MLDKQFIESDLVSCGSNISLESVYLDSNINGTFNYLYDTKEDCGYIVCLYFKNHLVGNILHVEIFDAGSKSRNNTLNQEEFRKLQKENFKNINSIYKDRLLFSYDFNIPYNLISQWNQILCKSKKSRSINFPWLSIVSNFILKSLQSVTNDKFAFDCINSNSNSKDIQLKLNKQFIEQIKDSLIIEKQNLQISDINSEFVSMDQIMNICFKSAEKAYDLFINFINSNNVSIRGATKSIIDSQRYWTPELKKENIQINEGEILDNAKELSGNVISIVQGLQEIIAKITQCTDESITLLEESFDHSINEESKIIYSALLTSRQQALIASRSIYSNCLQKVLYYLQKIDSSSKMFGSFKNEKFIELSKGCEFIINLLLCDNLSSLNSNEKIQRDDLLQEYVNELTLSKLISLKMFAVSALTEVASANQAIDNIFSKLRRDLNNIDVEVYIAECMREIRAYTEIHNNDELMYYVQVTNYTRKKIKELCATLFGINIFSNSNSDSRINLQNLLKKHSQLLSDKGNTKQMRKAFEIILREQEDKSKNVNDNNSNTKIIIDNGEFCLRVNDNKQSINSLYNKMLNNKSFVTVKELEKTKSHPQEETVMEKVKRAIYSPRKTFTSFFSSIYSYYSNSEQQNTLNVDDKEEDVSTSQNYHPGINNVPRIE